MKKTNVLLSAIATIVVCVCIIAGSTYAIFTSSDDVNVAATSGTVKVEANGTQDYTFTIDSTDDVGNRIYGTFQGTLLNAYDQKYE